MSHFEVTARDGAARAGVLRTAHGEVRTPAFMPVGTKATVKSLDPDELRTVGSQIILGNTYHLHFRPGDELIARLGGLHAFSGWDGPILTDSGGFQVFSLRDTLLDVDDDGVTFRSVYDGAPARFSPEVAARIQRNLGSDIAMAFDICPPAGVPRAELEEAVRLTTHWAARQRDEERAPGQLLFGIAQGAADPGAAQALDRGDRGARLRRPRARRPRGRRGAARRCSTRPAGRRRSSPTDKPRYFMGIGDAEGILRVIGAGIDMFDCVLPTRTARTGSALTATGRLNLRNARFADDPRPLEEGCGCPACARFSRAYVRHLVNQEEMLGLRLLSLHNLHFLLELTAGARAAIERGELEAYTAAALARLAGGPQEDPWNQEG